MLQRLLLSNHVVALFRPVRCLRAHELVAAQLLGEWTPLGVRYHAQAALVVHGRLLSSPCRGLQAALRRCRPWISLSGRSIPQRPLNRLRVRDGTACTATRPAARPGHHGWQEPALEPWVLTTWLRSRSPRPAG